MKSVQQTILGLVLAGTAFVFGSYLHREQPGSEHANPNAIQDNSQNAKYVWQDDLPHAPFQQPADSFNNGSPVAKANMSEPELVEANLVPDLSNAINVGDDFAIGESFGESQQKIAEPDFSRYAIEDYMETAQTIDPPAPMPHDPRGNIATESDIATPDFGQHFPSEIRVNRNQTASQTQQPRYEESLFRLRRPATIPNTTPIYGIAGNRGTPERIQQPAAAPTDFRPLVRKQPVRNTGQIHQARNSDTVSIRPRDRSPIMSESGRYETHRTSNGETLHDLAIKYYGDSAFYLDIYVANQSVLSNPGRVPAGIALKIPIYDQ